MMEKFFNPQAVAVIGASRFPQKLGYAILKNILDAGYQGRLYPINPKAKRIMHLKSYASVTEVEDQIDLAVIIVPADFVPQVLEECGQKGIKNINIISAGFREIGKTGQKREEKIKTIALKYDLNLLGPNSFGIINTLCNLNSTFASTQPLKGNIAFISQSGALASAFLDMAAQKNLGFSYFVSLGNKSGVTELEVIRYMANDDKLKAIFCYLEDIQRGKEFCEELRAIALRKPVIILKPGETEEAQKAISSHTGSIAGSFQAIKTGLKQNGALLCNTTEEFFNLMLVFNNFPVNFGTNVGIVTNAGGPSVLITERLVKLGLSIPDLSAHTIKALKGELPETINIRNPLDVVGDALAERYEKALLAYLEDPKIETILVLLTPQFMTEVEKTAKVIVKYAKQRQKLIMASFIGGPAVESGINYLQKNKVAHFTFPTQAAKVLYHLSNYKHWLEDSTTKRHHLSLASNYYQKFEGEKILGHKEKEYLTDREVFDLFELYQLPIADFMIVKNFEGMKNTLEVIPYPIVMKISSPKLIHKTEQSSVILNINTKEEAEKAFNELYKKAKTLINPKYFEGITIQEMVKGGVETIIGVKRDPSFGHLLMFGSGGIYTEVYKDVAFRLLPSDNQSLASMLEETKIFKILKGARNKRYAYEKIYDVLYKIQQLVIDFPQIVEMDLNPTVITQDRIKIVDAKIKVE